jgi:hypothetical protein
MNTNNHYAGTVYRRIFTVREVSGMAVARIFMVREVLGMAAAAPPGAGCRSPAGLGYGRGAHARSGLSA